MADRPERTNIFLCYACKDARYHDDVKAELVPALGSERIWSDKDIPAGTGWYEEINQALGRAKVQSCS